MAQNKLRRMKAQGCLRTPRGFAHRAISGAETGLARLSAVAASLVLGGWLFISCQPPRTATHSTGIEFVSIPAGRFTMGCSPGNGQATEAVVAAETGALGLLMEMKTGYLDKLGRWTGIDIFLDHGRGLAKTASRFFAKP